MLTLDIALLSEKENSEQALILSGAKDNLIKLWKFDSSLPFQRKIRCLATFKGHNENISGVCFAPKRKKFFASVSQDNTLKVWNVPSMSESSEEEESLISSAQMTIMAHQKYINAVRISPNDKLIATSSQDKTIKIWDAASLSVKSIL